MVWEAMGLPWNCSVVVQGVLLLLFLFLSILSLSMLLLFLQVVERLFAITLHLTGEIRATSLIVAMAPLALRPGKAPWPSLLLLLTLPTLVAGSDVGRDESSSRFGMTSLVLAMVVAATLWAVRQRRSSARREQEADVGEPSGSAKLHVTPESLLPGEQKEVGATRRNKPRREQQAQSRGGWGAAGG